MNTNNQHHPQNSSLKCLHFNKGFLPTIISASLLATTGVALALWPDEERSLSEKPASLSRSSHDQTSFAYQAQPTATADRNTTAPPVRRKVASPNNASTAEGGSSLHYLPNTSGVPKVYVITDEAQAVQPAALPVKGAALSAAQFIELMTGRIRFSPHSIPQSGHQVTDHTPLQIGQEVLLRWGSTWWAATVTGFEPDGAIRATYFGWCRSWDEAVPRSDLQLDTNTREKAMQTVYTYNP